MHNLDGNFPAVNRRRDDTERVLMYAEGPFLRGFACVAFDMLNEFGLWRGGVTLVQAGHEVNEAHDREIELLKKQDGLYTVIAAGAENGVKKTDKRLITCVTDCINLYKDYNNYLGRARNPELRVIVSCTNAEEFVYCENEKAYTRPQASFPAKFTAFLYERFKFFGGDLTKGLIILPCEAVENNGENLRKIMQKYANLWELSLEFMQWVNRSCVFTNTVTDRIVAGYPHDEADRICGDLGYRDELLCSTELFYFWAIESANYAGQLREELPFEQLKKAGLDIVISDDIKAHQLKKMRLFSGGTIAMAHAALLGGGTTASPAARDETFGRFTGNLLFRGIFP
ncbi:MAG: hypothetical protein FWH20_07545, partial [Oscillospiraceae bacterium]|nr:hypothetical protein [Oscillospiraceae bacterium]